MQESFHERVYFIQNKMLFLAIKKGHIEVADKCLNLGADVNYMEFDEELSMVSLNLVAVIYCCTCITKLNIFFIQIYYSADYSATSMECLFNQVM